MSRILLLFTLVALIAGCNKKQEKPVTEEETTHTYNAAEQEAREDSLALIAAYEAQGKIPLSVSATVETQEIKAASEEDAADDPAIWINPKDAEKSLVYGSNKKGGLAVYNLLGKEIAYYPLGKVNNVDIIYNFPIKKDSTMTILGCSNRTYQSVDLLSIDAEGELKNVTAEVLTVDTSLIDDIYGFCFAVDKKTNTSYCIINGKNGLMQQFEMLVGEKGIKLKLVRSIQFDSQTEGMVADDELGALYVGEEGKGIWKLTIDPGNNEKSFIKGSDDSNANISYDVEGLSLYTTEGGGYLVASSQGNFSYAVFDRMGDNAYINSFKIITKDDVDGVEETDGLEIVPNALGAAYPKGLMVVQDGFNYRGDTLLPQNFKFVSFEQVLNQLSATAH